MRILFDNGTATGVASALTDHIVEEVVSADEWLHPEDGDAERPLEVLQVTNT